MTQAERYLKLASLTERSERLDSSYHAAFYLLSTDDLLFKIACKHISNMGIDFAAIKRNCRGLDEIKTQVLSIAHNLFSYTSKCTVTPFDFSRLGYPVIDYVCDAIYIAGDLRKVQVKENELGILELSLDNTKYEKQKDIMESFSFYNDYITISEHENEI